MRVVVRRPVDPVRDRLGGAAAAIVEHLAVVEPGVEPGAGDADRVVRRRSRDACDVGAVIAPVVRVGRAREVGMEVDLVPHVDVTDAVGTDEGRVVAVDPAVENCDLHRGDRGRDVPGLGCADLRHPPLRSEHGVVRRQGCAHDVVELGELDIGARAVGGEGALLRARPHFNACRPRHQHRVHAGDPGGGVRRFLRRC